jgi:Zn-dependent peptidase ImmA (M78 family)
VLAYLRGLVPQRPLSFIEARHITELQANRLRGLLNITSAELPPEVIPGLPRIEVIEVSDLPASGASQWSEGKWVIAVNGQESWQRQRFSMGHELWHIINYRTTDFLCPGNRFTSSSAQAERLADYFSGCLHMPKQHLKRLVGEGLDAADLADTFGVSVPAVTVRLNQLGFSQSRSRCSHHRARAKGMAA